ncbi:MAG: exosortase system-associated protein, TIGR04073 family [Verrucomicrobiae bacterium]|nr:exosortase system-associated protein, TIGR04073 family [Verrucomicrobiae bacterium]
MRNRVTLFLAVAVTGLLAGGCAGPERKLGRGMSNFGEITRWGEMRRSIEQTALFESPHAAYTTGLVRGFNRSMARMGIGLYEIVTAPFPPYEPVFTNYLKPNPVYPDNYKPGLIALPALDSSTELGFSGGDVAPMFPNSRFRTFSN